MICTTDDLFVSVKHPIAALALLFLCLNFCNGQETYTLSGRVTIRGGKQPVPFASIFLANTLIGTNADGDGNFVLTVIPPGKYEMVVSSVGFKLQKTLLSVNGNLTGVEVSMEQEIRQLKEVVIKSSKSEYRKELALFKQYFIGQTQNAPKCNIVNVDDIQLGFDHDANVFTATSEQPIEIINRALGYKVYYSLIKFEIDFKAQKFTLAGMARFEELDSTHARDFKIVKERDRAYYGSLNHFMRSLRKETLASNKFELFVWARFMHQKPGEMTQRHDYRWLPINGYRFHRLPYDSVYKFRIVYKGDVQEYNYIPKDYKYRIAQTSLLTCMQHGLVIHENGFYDDPLSFFLEGYMGWREKVIAELLPYEYQPHLSLKEEKERLKMERVDSVRFARLSEE